MKQPLKYNEVFENKVFDIHIESSQCFLLNAFKNKHLLDIWLDHELTSLQISAFNPKDLNEVLEGYVSKRISRKGKDQTQINWRGHSILMTNDKFNNLSEPLISQQDDRM